MAVDVTGGDLKFVTTLDIQPMQEQIRKLESDIKKFSDKTEDAGKKTQNLFTNLISASAATEAAKKAFDFLSESIEAAFEKQDLLAGFKAQMENLGQGQVFDRLAESAEELAKQFTFLDTSEVVKGFQKLTDYGKLTEKQIKELMPVIIDFAAKNRVSIESATGTIIKALNGQGQSLKQFGINLKSNATEAQRLEAVMGPLANKVRGAADAFGASAQGQLASARQKFSDIKEEVGTELIPALTSLLNFVSKSIQGLKLFANDVKDLFSLRRLGATNEANERAAQEEQTTNLFVKLQVEKKVKQLKDEIAAGKTSVAKIMQDFTDYLQKQTLDPRYRRIAEGVLQTFSTQKVGGGGADINGDEAKKRAQDLEKAQREAERRQAALNRLFEQRATILQKIADIQRDTDNTGLTDEERAVDELAQKYDALIISVQKYNDKAKELGQKGISTQPVEDAKQVAIENLRLKQSADRYTTFLDEQKQKYLAFEEAKKQIGIDAAREQYSDLSGQFESYQDFLTSEVKKNLPKIQLALSGFGNLLNVGDQEKIKNLLKQVGDEGERQKQIQAQRFAEVLQLTRNYNDNRKEIEERYHVLQTALEKEATTMTVIEYDRRKKALQDAKAEELTALKNSLIRQSDLYKQMSEDTISFTREDLQKRMKEFEQQLASGFIEDENHNLQVITPEIAQDIQTAIDRIKALLASTNATAVAAGKVAGNFGKVGTILGSLRGLVAQFDQGLADVIGTMESLAGAGVDVATAVGQFATGDIVGGITSAISGISKAVGSIFGESEEEKRFKQRLKDIEAAQYLGEFKVNELYRERQREQVRLNELRLVGIQKETALLITQRKEVENQYNELFSKIQQLRFTGTDAQVQEFLANNPQLNAVQAQLIAISHQLPLLGKSFEDLEKLNTFGQLDGEAKEFFEQLKALKDAGVDVQRAWEALMKERQEIATGTTEDALLDSVVEMFRRGTTSAQDFAKNFEELMKGAVLNSLKFQYLQEPLKKFFEHFAELSSQGDLTSGQIDELETMYNGIISDAQKKFNDLQKIAGLNFSDNLSTSGNNLQTALKGMSEQTAELLTGQFAGQRVATLQLVDLTRVGNTHLNNISINTGTMVQQLKAAVTYLQDVVSGAASFKIR